VSSFLQVRNEIAHSEEQRFYVGVGGKLTVEEVVLAPHFDLILLICIDRDFCLEFFEHRLRLQFGLDGNGVVCRNQQPGVFDQAANDIGVAVLSHNHLLAFLRFLGLLFQQLSFPVEHARFCRLSLSFGHQAFLLVEP
jgi:hypothetical protein